MMASLVLRWNLFHGMKNRADIQKAKIAQHQLEMKKEEVQSQLDLQALTAHNNLEAAVKAVEASRAEALALEKAFEVVEKKYRNGQIPFIEYLDARTAMTNSKQNLIIALFEVKIKEAEYERAIAAFPL
jgi:outer membrane protein TolC